MRHTPLVTAILILSASGAFGQGPPSRTSSCVPGPNECAPPCYPSAVPEAAVPQAAPGMYVQPPAAGEFEGASSGLGIRGFGLRIPAVNLELPTLQLPSFLHFRRGAQMHVSSASAPYVSGTAAQFGMLTAGGQAAGVVAGTLNAQPQPADGAPQATPRTEEQCLPPCPPAYDPSQSRCGQTPTGQLAELRGQIRNLQTLVQQLALLQMQQNAIPANQIEQSTFLQPAQSAFEIIEDTTHRHRDSRPAVDDEARREVERQSAAYEQKCQEVDELRAQVAEMQRQYQLMLEMQQNRLFRQREERLRGQFDEQPTQPAAMVRPVRPTEDSQPTPGDFSRPRPEPPRPHAAAGQSVFGRQPAAQAAYNWQNSPAQAETGIARMSNSPR